MLGPLEASPLYQVSREIQCGPQLHLQLQSELWSLPWTDQVGRLTAVWLTATFSIQTDPSESRGKSLLHIPTSCWAPQGLSTCRMKTDPEAYYLFKQYDLRVNKRTEGSWYSIPRSILLPEHKIYLAGIQILLSVKNQGIVYHFSNVSIVWITFTCALQQKSFCQASVTKEKTVMTLCMVTQILFVGYRILGGFYLQTWAYWMSTSSSKSTYNCEGKYRGKNVKASVSLSKWKQQKANCQLLIARISCSCLCQLLHLISNVVINLS